MRVHGINHIKRRLLIITNYKKHKQELTEDFCGVCGYCGKDFKATLSESQIDHFIPQKKYPQFQNIYSNLVLSCKECNKHKLDDWPSNDPQKAITDDGKKGYIDPASDEFDENLRREEDGSIIGITEVGKYMVNRLGFAYRPIKEIYKIKLLYESIEKLKYMREENKNNKKYNAEDLNSLFLELEELRQIIHNYKDYK